MTSAPPTFFSLFFSLVVSLSYWKLHALRELSSSLPQYKIGNHFKLTKRGSSADSPRQKKYPQKGKLCRQSTTERDTFKKAREIGIDTRGAAPHPPPSSPQLPPPLLVARRALSGAGAGKKHDDATTLHIPHHNGRPQPTVTPS